MRLWTLHPALLDRQGLVAVWREGLLAQAVLAGRTKGYTAHPQLERFRAHPDPVGAVGSYLDAVRSEAALRGYRFDPARIDRAGEAGPIAATSGQLDAEWRHLLAKLAVRSPALHTAHRALPGPRAHPLFSIVDGGVEAWERGAG